MGINDKKVISIVGKDIWNHILDAVRDGTVNRQNMSDIAGLLNSKVGGSHLRRKECDEAEMREILGEYYNEEMFEMSTHEAVTKLIEVMNSDSVRLFPLAKKLEWCLKNVKRIVLLGSTGDGKSALGNSLLNLSPPNGFRESEDPESCTEKTEELTGAWRGTGSLCSIVDTPGMNDSQGRDVEHIAQIVNFLKAGKTVNTFLLVRKGNNLRMDRPFKDMLRTFEMVFGESFWSKVVMSISNTKYDEEEEAKIQRSIGKWVDLLKKEFPGAQTSLPSVILDTGKSNNPKFKKESEELWKICDGMEGFECKDFHKMEQELQQGELERARLTRLLSSNESRKEFSRPINVSFPSSEAEKEDILCQVDLCMNGIRKSDYDLEFLQEITHILSSKAKSLPWNSITFKAESLTHGSTILHYSITLKEPLCNQEEYEMMELLLHSAVDNLDLLVPFANGDPAASTCLSLLCRNEKGTINGDKIRDLITTLRTRIEKGGPQVDQWRNSLKLPRTDEDTSENLDYMVLSDQTMEPLKSILGQKEEEIEGLLELTPSSMRKIVNAVITDIQFSNIKIESVSKRIKDDQAAAMNSPEGFVNTLDFLEKMENKGKYIRKI